MCTFSNIGSDWTRTFPQRFPELPPIMPRKSITPGTWIHNELGVSQAEFDKLKREVEELKKLLEAAKAYDAATGQPDCETDEKVDLIKRVAELVGVDLEDLFE